MYIKHMCMYMLNHSLLLLGIQFDLNILGVNIDRMKRLYVIILQYAKFFSLIQMCNTLQIIISSFPFIKQAFHFNLFLSNQKSLNIF